MVRPRRGRVRRAVVATTSTVVTVATLVVPLDVGLGPALTSPVG